MLIPIGFFGGGAAGSYELISTAYGTGSSGVVTFSSIPSTYKHLQIRWVARNTTSDSPTIWMRLNSDTGANYTRHILRADPPGNVQSLAATGLDAAQFIYSMSRNVTANAHTASIVDVLDYASTSKNTTLRGFHGVADSADFDRINLTSSVWLNTAAVSTISLTNASGNFTSTSRFSLYGIKG